MKTNKRSVTQKRVNKKLVSLLCLLPLTALGQQQGLNISEFDVEESRVDKAQLALPKVSNLHQSIIERFKQELAKPSLDAKQTILTYAKELWQASVKRLQQANDGDDRGLYWARLQLRKLIKSSDVFKAMSRHQQSKLLADFELESRGQSDIKFDKHTDLKILLTGFDPFFLDRHIDQSNPSGVTAMMLDNQVIQYQGITAEIETVVVPVRFADFDQGMIENILTPYVEKSVEPDGIDFLFTVSMGRKDFDIERFPGLRRSAKAPDNLNVYTGASSTLPLLPMLEGLPLSGSVHKGAEFVEFSLPVDKMKRAKTQYQVIDNRKISTLKGKREANSLLELADEISVSGSGGGYLSNEISYRSMLVRDKYNPTLPVGHIHTPRIAAFDPNTSKAITKDIKLMLEQVLVD